MAKAKKKIEEVRRDDAIDELVEAFVNFNDLYDMARNGYGKFAGYEIMSDKELVSEYINHFGNEIKIIN